jgi:hypothetical protein
VWPPGTVSPPRKTSRRQTMASIGWPCAAGLGSVMRWTEVPAAAWRTPQELVQEGFGRGRVVMLNEAHDGLKRCVHVYAAMDHM